MNTKKILSLLTLLFTIGTAHCSDPDTFKVRLLNLAKSTPAYKKYNRYHEIAKDMPDNLKLFDESCKKASTQPNNQPNNTCNLFNKYTEVKNLFDTEYQQVKKDAENTPQAKTYEEFSGEKLIPDNK